ncbi:TPA: hypothetical protein TVN69_001359 [Streptococcus equi subsp. zooepidemicus]|nr:hypothetical protein [Streptococcus equi subsp. zooepidemicus]HEL1230173.1 hypothetical protein [Streptococcus equi subsp. zooepidemicus]
MTKKLLICRRQHGYGSRLATATAGGFVRSFFDVTGFSCVGLGDLKPYDADKI